MVERGGFEPSNPKEQIYSLPRLTTSLSLHILVAPAGIEPATHGFSVRVLYQLSYEATKNGGSDGI